MSDAIRQHGLFYCFFFLLLIYIYKTTEKLGDMPNLATQKLEVTHVRQPEDKIGYRPEVS